MATKEGPGTGFAPQLGSRAAMRELDFPIGQPMPGTKWVVRGQLGRGGMGVVFDVVKAPGIAGAAKVMKPGLLQVRGLAERFLEEARLLTLVQHKHIVRVIDCDTLPDGVPFMVMERLKGHTLRAAMREWREKARGGGASLPASLAFQTIAELCDGLAALHTQRPMPLVHRDVKPENIFLHQVEGVGGKAQVKILDFGLTGVGGQEATEVVGTPRYMAPEQIRGETISEQTDLYAAALVLYELLTGRLPWDVDVRNVEAMMHAHLHMEPRAVSRYCPWIPAAVDRAISRALAKDAEARPASAAQFVDLVRELKDANDGTAYGDADVNTTAPTMASLARGEWSSGAYDTDRSMSVPPVDGAASPAVPGAGELPSVVVSDGIEVDVMEASGRTGRSHDGLSSATRDSGDRTTQVKGRGPMVAGSSPGSEESPRNDEREALKETVKRASKPAGSSASSPRRRRAFEVLAFGAGVGVVLLCGLLGLRFAGGGPGKRGGKAGPETHAASAPVVVAPALVHLQE